MTKNPNLITKVTIDYLIDMIEYQIENFPVHLKGFFSEIIDDNLKVNTIQCWMLDMVSNEFGIEEEDWNKLPGLETSADYMQANRTLMELIEDFIK